ncbi:adenosylmethionine--8-amino-7-oxononanoate transaminase [Ignatzschineria sp. RMDPL8A]|uniref:adenosylmethionine--8-amino-7-oxononanoate transaminase n=1 Tax=Ignatzschineria sp. RMDPL8A TaxID=2999236 RepID=UPI0016ACF346|nr:adenosylmethionine--8-amino-7-oxononanoate transaminase [Ignatzschineria sp. RMDPL8A]MDG9730643.1 adenosylmethionine--8-amino-7-oxononanoate transaminase [Ignatzschineria sp. RMDPL8A]NLD09801.1 adenosylmethionine--8-amino-7-oxononanoate transaminase [Xanthomonadaceae bacterium]
MTKIDTSFDTRHIWHPYTSMSEPLPCYPVDSASGVTLHLEDGRTLIDGMSSWWAALHGYNHPVLNEAIKNQLDKMSHVMFGGITHRPAVDLCKRLVEMTPDPLECVFLADSGSVAVEVALKMAFQYWHAKGEKRHKIVSLSHAYHGDTFGAMSVCDPKNSMHSIYEGYLPEHLFAPTFTLGFDDEWDDSAVDELFTLVEDNADDISAIIVEPIVQGAGGMRMYHPNYLKTIRELCDHFGILMIADEIATGFGRTGKLFACEHAEIAPDIMCVGKAITGGYMTLSATLTTRHIADTISNGEAKCFMHGPTFMGNPLACSVALASLSLLDNGAWESNVSRIEAQLKEELFVLKGHEDIEDVRVLGAIGVIELKTPINQEKMQAYFVENGVWIRPFNKLVYIMPPYVIKEEELRQLTGSLVNLLNRPDFKEFLA